MEKKKMVRFARACPTEQVKIRKAAVTVCHRKGSEKLSEHQRSTVTTCNTLRVKQASIDGKLKHYCSKN